MFSGVEDQLVELMEQWIILFETQMVILGNFPSDSFEHISKTDTTMRRMKKSRAKESLVAEEKVCHRKLSLKLAHSRIWTYTKIQTREKTTCFEPCKFSWGRKTCWWILRTVLAKLVKTKLHYICCCSARRLANILMLRGNHISLIEFEITWSSW